MSEQGARVTDVVPVSAAEQVRVEITVDQDLQAVTADRYRVDKANVSSEMGDASGYFLVQIAQHQGGESALDSISSIEVHSFGGMRQTAPISLDAVHRSGIATSFTPRAIVVALTREELAGTTEVRVVYEAEASSRRGVGGRGRWQRLWRSVAPIGAWAWRPEGPQPFLGDIRVSLPADYVAERGLAMCSINTTELQTTIQSAMQLGPGGTSTGALPYLSGLRAAAEHAEETVREVMNRVNRKDEREKLRTALSCLERWRADFNETGPSTLVTSTYVARAAGALEPAMHHLTGEYAMEVAIEGFGRVRSPVKSDAGFLNLHELVVPFTRRRGFAHGLSATQLFFIALVEVAVLFRLQLVTLTDGVQFAVTPGAIADSREALVAFFLVFPPLLFVDVIRRRPRTTAERSTSFFLTLAHAFAFLSPWLLVVVLIGPEAPGPLRTMLGLSALLALLVGFATAWWAPAKRREALRHSLVRKLREESP